MANCLAKPQQINKKHRSFLRVPRLGQSTDSDGLVIVVDYSGAILVDLWQAILCDVLLFLGLASRVEGGTLSMAADAHGVTAVAAKAICSRVVLECCQGLD
jgi:hypothetical protein